MLCHSATVFPLGVRRTDIVAVISGWISRDLKNNAVKWRDYVLTLQKSACVTYMEWLLLIKEVIVRAVILENNSVIRITGFSFSHAPSLFPVIFMTCIFPPTPYIFIWYPFDLLFIILCYLFFCFVSIPSPTAVSTLSAFPILSL